MSLSQIIYQFRSESFLKPMFNVNVFCRDGTKTVKNMIGGIPCIHHCKWRLSGLGSIIPCDSHLPPHCAAPLPDQWAGQRWIAFRREGLSDTERDWQKLVDVCFVLSLQCPQDSGGRIAKLKHSECRVRCYGVWRDLSSSKNNLPFKWGNVSSVSVTIQQWVWVCNNGYGEKRQDNEMWKYESEIKETLVLTVPLAMSWFGTGGFRNVCY